MNKNGSCIKAAAFFAYSFLVSISKIIIKEVSGSKHDVVQKHINRY